MKDSEEIIQTALNYIQGWYEGNVERVDKALHPDLVKRRFIPGEKTWKVDTLWMIDATKKGVGVLPDASESKCQVQILDIHQNIASVKITSIKYIDYLHLVRINAIWKIVDVLWDLV